MPNSSVPGDDGTKPATEIEKRLIVRAKQQTSRRVFLDPSQPTVRSITRVVVVTLVLLFFAERVETIVGSITALAFLVVLSVFFAYLMDPLVRALRLPFVGTAAEKYVPRSLAIIGAYLIVFSILGVVIFNLAPRISNQGHEFMANLPTYTASVQETGTDISRRFNRLRLPQDIQDKINEQAVAVGSKVTGSLGTLVIDLVTYLPWLILVPILAFFFLKDVNQFRLTVLRMFPAGRWRLRAESILQDVNTTLAAYTRAQLLSCLIIGVLCTVGFLLIGIKYALLLGLVAGVFEFVPLIGPACLFIIAVSSAGFSDTPQNGFWVAGFLVVLRITHDYVTYPRIVRGGIHLHPILIILSVLAGEQVAGIPGVFLAIPIVAILTVIYRHAMEHQGSRGLFDGLIEAEDERAEEIV